MFRCAAKFSSRALALAGVIWIGCDDPPTGPPLPTAEPPTATITAPVSAPAPNLASFFLYETIFFTGSATDPQDGTNCCLAGAKWFSGVDGIQIGTGGDTSWDRFKPTVHRVEWIAVDLDGNTSDTAEVSFFVRLRDMLMWDVEEQEVWVGDAIDVSMVVAGGNPAWSPDGSRIAFERFDGTDFEVWIADADGSNQQQITGNALDDDSPAWSPDGTRLAFVGESSGNRDIYIFDLVTTLVTQVTTDPAEDGEPDWNGSTIAFESTRDGDRDIWTVPDDLSAPPTKLTINAFEDKDPHWFPDGTKIVFSSNRDGNQEIYVMDADGSNQVNVTNHPSDDREPEVSPDALEIVFVSDRDGNEDIWFSRINGTDPVRSGFMGRNSPSEQAGHPRWKP